MKEKILELLKNSTTFISGQELSEKFGVSRTAVWKAIRQLEEVGYVIEAVRNKGYRLRSEPDVLNEEQIRNYLHCSWAGQKIDVFTEIDSTNNEAKRQAEAGAPHGLLVVAEQQSAGRGRRGRAWDSPEGCGIFMSLLLKPDIEPSNASMLTLVMALAVRKALMRCGVETMIKWPNDIVSDGKKLCGILTEMSAQIDCINHIVIGVGINVHNESFPEGVQDVATSAYLQSGRHICRAELVAAVLEEFEGYYEIYLETQNLQKLIDEYNQFLINCGRRVQVLDPKGDYTGTALRANSNGELLVSTEDRVVNVSAGEVSVRGIYGYV